MSILQEAIEAYNKFASLSGQGYFTGILLYQKPDK